MAVREKCRREEVQGKCECKSDQIQMRTAADKVGGQEGHRKLNPLSIGNNL